MICDNCRTDCPHDDAFCRNCGQRLVPVCPRCRADIATGDNFCGRCGFRLAPAATPIGIDSEGGRRLATVLFSDLNRYTALTERLDPEEVKDIIGRIFEEISRVVAGYEGRIEKFIGDAAMILFGIPESHEDDPVRALRAAFEIHARVERVSRHFEARIDQRLSMHSGVNTGLVVTGRPDPDTGLYSVTGDTVNVAARLQALAGPDEILVGHKTYSQAKGYFEFEALAPTPIKGKSEAVRIFRARGPSLYPARKGPASGRRAALIGRRKQLKRMQAVLRWLKDGESVILSVRGEAGTGKSRLVEEFRAVCRGANIQWIEAHAHAYAQNQPYSLIIDLLRRAFSIRENDPLASIKMKVENGLKKLVEDRADAVTYIAGLFSLRDPKGDAPSPEIWKSRLCRTIKEILWALANRSTTVICLEDLHWADPSSLELLRAVAADFHYPMMLIWVYRPTFAITDTQNPFKVGIHFEDIFLNELTPSQTRKMVKALLDTDRIPEELSLFVGEKIGGNPFYLEEVVNSLIEGGTLVSDKGRWVVAKPIGAADVPPTIQGVISGRLDRLDKPLRRALQEASVIGRNFFYDILQKISTVPHKIDTLLRQLEQLGLIQVRSLQPYLEYLFRHALIQEVVYSGLLKSERRHIHEKIGLIIEEIFDDRLSEFYESLAYHFQRSGQSVKAVAYLIKAGEKSTHRYGLEEAHHYFEAAYRLLQQSPASVPETFPIMVDVLNKWAFVYYYRGRYRELYQLLTRHRDQADTLVEGPLPAMFYAWLGCALWHRERFEEAHSYLLTALKMGENAGDPTVVGYAASWLVWVSAELGRFGEALAYAAKAQSSDTRKQPDSYVQVNSLAGMGYAFWHRGQRKRVFEVGRRLLRIGTTKSDSRSRVMGYCCIGWSRLIDGDVHRAAACFHKAVAVSADPWYSVFPQLALCYGLISEGKIREAEMLIDRIIEFSRERGAEFAGTPAIFFKGILLVSRGKIYKGLSLLERQLVCWKKSGSRLRHALCGCILAEIYARMACRASGPAAVVWFKNPGAVLKVKPFAARKASTRFARYIEAANEIGAQNVVGRAYLHWGHMQQARGRSTEAARRYRRALDCFQQCDAVGYISQVQEALRSLQQV